MGADQLEIIGPLSSLAIDLCRANDCRAGLLDRDAASPPAAEPQR
jgi:hypothetical protein